MYVAKGGPKTVVNDFWYPKILGNETRGLEMRTELLKEIVTSCQESDASIQYILRRELDNPPLVDLPYTPTTQAFKQQIERYINTLHIYKAILARFREKYQDFKK